MNSVYWMTGLSGSGIPPRRIESLLNDSRLIRRSLAHFPRILLDKSRHSVNMTTKPAHTILINQIRKLLAQIPKICPELLRLLGRGNFFIRHTAPGAQCPPGVVNAAAWVSL